MCPAQTDYSINRDKMLGENQNQNKILEVKNSIAETMGRSISGPDVAEERMSEY